jgi:aspartate/methionine/tyrosine aminotransferase
MDKRANRFAAIELSLIRQINALATPLSVNLGIGEPNVEPDETLRDFARRAATTSWQYSPNAGSLPLRKRLGEATGYDPKSAICVTAGTQEALFAIMQAFVNPGDEVLVPNPGFLSYATVVRIAGGTPVTYDLEPPAWRVDAAALLEKITPKTKLIVVNSPSNPLGTVIDEETLRKIAAAGPLVVSDEIYGEIWYDVPPLSMMGMGDNVIVVNGMSKSHAMTGLRLAWTLGHPEVIKVVITAHQYIATCASVFSQALAELILGDPNWNASWLERMRAQFRDQREACIHAIRRELDAGITSPGGAFYAFVPVRSNDTVTFAKTLATDAAVLVIPGVAFGSMGEGFIRISYAASLDAIVSGIERIGRYLGGSQFSVLGSWHG